MGCAAVLGACAQREPPGRAELTATSCDAPLVSCARPWGSEELGRDCTDPRTDPANCGGCGEVCESGVCSGGRCVDGDCDLPCAGAAICCPLAWSVVPACTSPNRDPFNCGGCGRVCASTESCEHGKCECLPGFIKCGDVCVDVQSDEANCGGCGHACGTGTAFCDDGECVPCEEVGLMECDGVCVDLLWDHGHCGDCGSPCAEDEACVQGACVAGNGPCPESCSAGGANRICCFGECIDPRTSDHNCGGCSRAFCPSCEQTCRDGTCVPSACDDPDD